MADIHMIWDQNYNDFLQFIHFAIISKETAPSTIVNIFMALNISKNDSPMPAPWIREHVCLTDDPSAPEASLVAHVMQKCLVERQTPSDKKRIVLLVQSRHGQHEELVSILNRNSQISNQYIVRIFQMESQISSMNGIANGDQRSGNYSRFSRRQSEKLGKFIRDEIENHFTSSNRSIDGDSVDGDFSNGNGFSTESNCQHCKGGTNDVIPMRRSWPGPGQEPSPRRARNQNIKCEFCLSKQSQAEKMKDFHISRFELNLASAQTDRYPNSNQNGNSNQSGCKHCLQNKSRNGLVHISAQHQNNPMQNAYTCQCYKYGREVYTCKACLASQLFQVSYPYQNGGGLPEQMKQISLKENTNKQPRTKNTRTESAPPSIVFQGMKNDFSDKVSIDNNENVLSPSDDSRSPSDGMQSRSEADPLYESENSDEKSRKELSSSMLTPLPRDETKAPDEQDETKSPDEQDKVKSPDEQIEIESPKDSYVSESPSSCKKESSGSFENEIVQIMKDENKRGSSSETKSAEHELKVYSSKSCQTRLESRNTQNDDKGFQIDLSEVDFDEDFHTNPEQLDENTQMKSVSTSPLLDWTQTPDMNTNTGIISRRETPEVKTSLKFDYDLFDDDYDEKMRRKDIPTDYLKAPKYNSKKQVSPRNGEYSCQFCPDRKFRSHHVWKIHMKNCHKKCNCPCGQYFETRNDYLVHFYEQFPLPCFMERKCPDRFRSLYYQAIHHRDKHFSDSPFFCVECFDNDENAEWQKKISFKNIKALRIHAESFEHDPKAMFLISSANDQDESNLPWTMKCTGINFS